MNDGHVNLLKLCVGAEKVADLEAWQKRQRAQRKAQGLEPVHIHVTRMWPKRQDEILNGGSLYWVFKGLVLARQEIARLDEVVGSDGIRRCGIVLVPEIIRTQPMPRRPFQGWRYFAPEDVPEDLDTADGGEPELPAGLATALSDMGVR